MATCCIKLSPRMGVVYVILSITGEAYNTRTSRDCLDSLQLLLVVYKLFEIRIIVRVFLAILPFGRQ